MENGAALRHVVPRPMPIRPPSPPKDAPEVRSRRYERLLGDSLEPHVQRMVSVAMGGIVERKMDEVPSRFERALESPGMVEKTRRRRVEAEDGDVVGVGGVGVEVFVGDGVAGDGRLYVPASTAPYCDALSGLDAVRLEHVDRRSVAAAVGVLRRRRVQGQRREVEAGLRALGVVGGGGDELWMRGSSTALIDETGARNAVFAVSTELPPLDGFTCSPLLDCVQWMGLPGGARGVARFVAGLLSRGGEDDEGEDSVALVLSRIWRRPVHAAYALLGDRIVSLSAWRGKSISRVRCPLPGTAIVVAYGCRLRTKEAEELIEATDDATKIHSIVPTDESKPWLVVAVGPVDLVGEHIHKLWAASDIYPTPYDAISRN